MKIGFRQEVGPDDYRERLVGISGMGIELALRHMMQEFVDNDMPRLDEIAAGVKGYGVNVRSVHAPQGRLSGDRFMSWALPTVRFAEAVGAPMVVFHPENVAKADKPNLQIMALRNIKTLQRETTVTVAIETFGSKKRVITPEETIEKGLPMVLDTSHLFHQRTFNMIRDYSQGIVAVHLSEQRFDLHENCEMPHMPVEAFGIEVLEALQGKGWDGVVTLEYLPWYHDRLIPDVISLTQMFCSTESP